MPFGNSVVVASVGLDNNHGGISAYIIDDDSWLAAVPVLYRDLQARLSTIEFSQNGNYLIVNEPVTGKVKVFGMNGNALSKQPVSLVDSPRSEKHFQTIPVGFAVGKN